MGTGTDTVKVANPANVDYKVKQYSVPMDSVGKADGIPPLDSNSQIPSIYIPVTESVQSFYVASIADMLLLTGVVAGDRCLVYDDPEPNDNGEYVAIKDDPTLEADWGEVPVHNAVSSVNGLVGVVNLDSTDIPEIADNRTDIDAHAVTIGQNTSKGLANEVLIGTNTADILTNTSDIATNTANVGINTSDIAGHETRIDDIETLNGNQGTVINDNSLAIADLESPDSIAFNDVTGSEPVWAPGQAYYASGTFNIHGEFDGVTLQLGQEQYIKVSNVSGATIANGKPVYVTGVSGGFPAIDLAQADTFTKSRVIGITTMDIATGATGLVTTIGSVSDLDTNGLTPGDILYLSSTVAGGFTETAPDIATSLGSTLTADLTAGKIFVKVNNHIVLPQVFASMAGGDTVSGTIPVGYETIDAYVSGTQLAMPINQGLGTINVPTTGVYRVTINGSITFNDSGNQQETITIGINDGTSTVAEIPTVVSKNAEGVSFYPSVLFDAVANATYHLEIRASTVLNNAVFALLTFEIESTHIR